MGDLLRKMFLGGYDNKSDAQIEDVAEGALQMQEQLARDVIALAEQAGVKRSDPRVVRATEIFERLR